MATANRCSVDQKDPGSMHCTGCNQYFCKKHLRIHQDEMSSELDKIIQERDHLQDIINKEGQNDEQQNPIIQKISQWRDCTIQMIEQAAVHARQQAINLLNAQRLKLSTDFNSFTKELVELKESENYVEHDLKRLNDMVKKFQQDLEQIKQPTTIELHTEQADKISWNTFIYVEKRTEMTRQSHTTNDSSRTTTKKWPACSERINEDEFVDHIEIFASGSSRKSKSVEKTKQCPVCLERFDLTVIRDHVDMCAKGKSQRQNVANNMKECPVCHESIDEDEYTPHLGKCAIKLAQKKSKPVKKMKECPICNDEFNEDEFTDHRERCAKRQAKQEPKVGKKMKECPTCSENISTNDYEDHVADCRPRRSQK